MLQCGTGAKIQPPAVRASSARPHGGSRRDDAHVLSRLAMDKGRPLTPNSPRRRKIQASAHCSAMPTILFGFKGHRRSSKQDSLAMDSYNGIAFTLPHSPMLVYPSYRFDSRTTKPG